MGISGYMAVITDVIAIRSGPLRFHPSQSGDFCSAADQPHE